jgi:ParB-like chromosome segregation protein Spo0J
MSDKLKLDKLLPSVVPPNIETLRAHPIAAAFPMMSKADFEALKASIADQGFQDHEPIVLYGEPRMILDGRNRLKACLEVGHKFNSKNFVIFTGSYEEAEAFSNAKNGARRHLTNEQKAERIKEYIDQNPGLSSREIGRRLSCSHATVESYRTKKSAVDKEYQSFKKAWNALSDENKEKFLQECSV